MRAEWEEAPARVRSTKNNTPVIISIGISLRFLLGGAYWIEKKKVVLLHSPITSQKSPDKPPAQPTQQIGKTASRANYEELPKQALKTLQTPRIANSG